jgi:hypothetical protein
MAQAQTVQKTTDEVAGLRDKLAANPTLQAEMVKNPYQTLISLGVPESVVSKSLAPPRASAAAATSSDDGISISSHWWGYQLVLSNQLCGDIEAGLAGSSAIAAAIAVVQPELAPVAGLIAAGLVGMGAVIQLANQGNGVHFDLYWAELLVPPTLVAALIPIPNKKS